MAMFAGVDYWQASVSAGICSALLVAVFFLPALSASSCWPFHFGPVLTSILNRRKILKAGNSVSPNLFGTVHGSVSMVLLPRFCLQGLSDVALDHQQEQSWDQLGCLYRGPSRVTDRLINGFLKATVS